MRMIMLLIGLLVITVQTADAQQRYMRNNAGTKEDTCRDRAGTDRCR
jgi:hypothetical protein